MATTQEQAVVIKRFRQNQSLFIRYNTVDGVLKNKIVIAVQLVFLKQLVDQLTGFVQVSALAMFQNIFTSYRAIDKIDLK